LKLAGPVEERIDVIYIFKTCKKLLYPPVRHSGDEDRETDARRYKEKDRFQREREKEEQRDQPPAGELTDPDLLRVARSLERKGREKRGRGRGRERERERERETEKKTKKERKSKSKRERQVTDPEDEVLDPDVLGVARGQELGGGEALEQVVEPARPSSSSSSSPSSSSSSCSSSPPPLTGCCRCTRTSIWARGTGR
jgi:hypothetical protein